MSNRAFLFPLKDKKNLQNKIKNLSPANCLPHHPAAPEAGSKQAIRESGHLSTPHASLRSESGHPTNRRLHCSENSKISYYLIKIICLPISITDYPSSYSLYHYLHKHIQAQGIILIYQ